MPQVSIAVQTLQTKPRTASVSSNGNGQFSSDSAPEPVRKQRTISVGSNSSGRGLSPDGARYKLRERKRKSYKVPAINSRNTVPMPFPLKKRRRPDISKDPLYQKEQQRLAERYLRQHVIQQIKKLSGIKEPSRIPDARPLNYSLTPEEEWRRQRSLSNPIKFEYEYHPHSIVRTRSGSGHSKSSPESLPSSWDGSAFGDMRLNSMPNSPDMRSRSPLLAPPPAQRLPPALIPRLEERTPSPPPNVVSLDSGIYETNDIKHNKRVMRQENIVYPSPELKPSEPNFSTTLDIDWDLVNRQREKNELLIGDFLQKRATREILLSAGLRHDRRRTAVSIPLDSVKPVPGATYFKTEGNQLKVDIDRGVKWSKTNCKWVAKTMYAGTKFTLGYFADKRIAERAYLAAVDAKRNGTIKNHLLNIGAEYTDGLGRTQVHQKRGRGRPRKNPIIQGRTLWDRIMPKERPDGSPPRGPMITGQPYKGVSPGVFMPQKSPRTSASQWDATDAARVLLKFRQNVQRASSTPTTPAVKPERESTPGAEVEPTAFKLPVSEMSDVSSEDEDMAMFGMS